MTVLASSILTRVRAQLVDTSATPRWSDQELLGWLSEGQRTIVAGVPWAAPVKVSLGLVAGVEQTLPSAGYKLITVYHNVTSSGTPGPACLEIDRNLLDRQYSTWPADPPAPEVKAWWYDENDPLHFYIYPPNDGTGNVEINYSVMPVDVAALGTPLEVLDIYQTALFDYVMGRAHQKDSDYAAGGQLVELYMKLFTAFVATQQGKGG